MSKNANGSRLLSSHPQTFTSLPFLFLEKWAKKTVAWFLDCQNDDGTRFIWQKRQKMHPFVKASHLFFANQQAILIEDKFRSQDSCFGLKWPYIGHDKHLRSPKRKHPFLAATKKAWKQWVVDVWNRYYLEQECTAVPILVTEVAPFMNLLFTKNRPERDMRLSSLKAPQKCLTNFSFWHFLAVQMSKPLAFLKLIRAFLSISMHSKFLPWDVILV